MAISYPTWDEISLGFGVNAARRFERTCLVLAQLIDVSLMWFFLVAGIAQTVFLFSMVAGQVVG